MDLITKKVEVKCLRCKNNIKAGNELIETKSEPKEYMCSPCIDKYLKSIFGVGIKK